MKTNRTNPRILYLCCSLLIYLSSISITQAEGGGTFDPELIQLYKSAGINPFDYAAANNLAVKLATEGQYELAEKLLKRANSLEPGRKDILDNLAIVRGWIQQVKTMPVTDAERYQKSFRKTNVPAAPNSWTVPDLITEANEAEILAETQPTDNAGNPFDPNTLIDQADLKIRKRDYRGAIKYLERAKNLDPFRTEIDSKIERVKELAPEIFINTAPVETATIDGVTGDNENIQEVPMFWSIDKNGS